MKTGSRELQIISVADHRKKYLPLLLLADEQEDMIDRYLAGGDMYVLLLHGAAAGVCLVKEESSEVLEIKNLAVRVENQRQGYGRMLIRYVAEKYRGRYATLQVGTGENPSTLYFYESCGFRRWGAIPDFFTDNYDHVICEDGVVLKDMILLRQEL